MGDQGFDVVHRSSFHRWCGQRMIRFVRPFWHVLDALLDDTQALSHLLDSYGRAAVAIASVRGGNVELEVFIAGIGLSLPEVPIQPAGARVRPGHAPLDGLVDGVAADALRPWFDDGVTPPFAVVL